jgi:hypothetical protein
MPPPLAGASHRLAGGIVRLRRTDLDTSTVWLPQHYNPSHAVEWRGRWCYLGFGTTDRVTFWRDLDEPEALYVVGLNHLYGYVTLERFDDDSEPRPDAADLYAPEREHHVQDQAEADRLLELAEHTLIRRWMTDALPA